MAVTSYARKKLIAPGSNDPRIIPIGAILHVAVSDAKSLFDYFLRRSGGIESHYYIRKDGTLEQYRDDEWEADANLHANSFYKDGKRYGFISIETEGFGPGRWTKPQLATIKRLLADLSQRHGFPLRQCPGPYSPGVGYHTMFGAPSAWTPVAKSCPGAARKRQFRNILVPWMRTAGKVTTVSRRMDPDNYFMGARGPWVAWLGRRLVAHGFDNHHDGDGYQPGRKYTRYDKRNVRAFQRAQGWSGSDADGYPGKETLRRLRAKPKRKAPARKPAPKRPTTPTRITRARDDIQRGLDALHNAEQNGRTGSVQRAANLIEKALRVLPPR